MSNNSSKLIDRYLSKTKSDAYLLADNKFPIKEWIDSGNFLLNALISADWKNGGYPSGRFSQFVGPNSVGKSYLSIQGMINAQNMGYILFLVDSEFGGDPNSWIDRGIDPKMFIHLPDQHIKKITGELLSFINSIEKDEKALVVVDSVGNLSSNKETEDMTAFIDKRDMTRAQELKAMFRQLVVPAGKKHVPFFIVNHEYDSPDMFSGKTPGGGGGPLYGSSIIVSMTKSQEKEGTEHIGTGLTCTNKKNRFAREKEKIRIVIDYDKGLDRYSGLLDAAKDMDWCTSAGSWYTFKNGDKVQKKEMTPEFWDKILKEGFGDALNKRFRYQSQAEGVLKLEEEKPVEDDKKDNKNKKKEKK